MENIKQIKVISLFCYLIIAMALFNGFFAMPSADDFIYAQRSEQYGVFGAVVFEFNQWAGRYFSTLLLTSYVHYFDLINDFWLIPVCLILLSLASFFIFFYSFEKGLSNQYKNFLALVLFTIYILTIPRLSQTFYWMAGGFTYQVGNLIFLLTCAWWVKIYNMCHLKWFTWQIYFVLNSLLIILYAGTNETLALVSLVIIFYIILFHFYFKRKLNSFFLGLFVINIVTLLIMINSPGVAARGGETLGQIGFFLSLAMSYYSGIKFLFLSSLVMFLITANSFIRQISQSIITSINLYVKKLSTIEKLLIIFFFISLFGVFYFPGYWARGEEPPQRSMNILLMIAIFGWYPFIALLMNLFNIKQYQYPYIKNNYVYLGLSLFSILLVFLKLNMALIVTDLSLAPKSYQEQQERIKLIEKERQDGNNDVSLAPLTIDPETTRTFIDNDFDGYNNAIAHYFKINSIQIKKMQP